MSGVKTVGLYAAMCPLILASLLVVFRVSEVLSDEGDDDDGIAGIVLLLVLIPSFQPKLEFIALQCGFS